jgi:hypothetical protein
MDDALKEKARVRMAKVVFILVDRLRSAISERLRRFRAEPRPALQDNPDNAFVTLRGDHGVF